jgi:hypothetical protein
MSFGEMLLRVADWALMFWPWRSARNDDDPENRWSKPPHGDQTTSVPPSGRKLP